MNSQLKIFLCFAFVSLGAATLLYSLFGYMNEAGYTWTGNEKVQLAGPIGAFFIVMLLCPYVYNKIGNSFEDRLKNIVGTWEIESESSQHKRKACSETTIELVDGEIRVNGGIFFDVDSNGMKGTIIGSWNAEMAVSNGHKLMYFYNLTDDLNHAVFRGIAELVLQSDKDSKILSGRWQIIGSNDVHNGQITMKKK